MNNKNKLVVLILMFSMVLGGCGTKEVNTSTDTYQNTDIIIDETFEDDIFKDYVSEYIDRNNDGLLSEDEINKVYTIKINSFYDEKYKDLKSIKGIEYFSELKELTCYDCGLTDLDVSRNLKLKKLIVGYTDIEKLDISHNKELMELNCDSTKIKYIDLSENLLLEDINICHTDIKEIDLKDLKELRGFGCNGTLITELNLTNNIKLEGLSIDDTRISKLDLSKNVDLKGITCTDACYLHSLDLSNNPKMESIYCQRSGIKELDLSNNPKMFEVECDESTVIIGGDNLTFLQRFPDED